MAPIELPEPERDGQTSVERTIATRESRRVFAESPVGIEDVAQLLWAAQGITHRTDGVRMRAAPSAGATYPLTVLLTIASGGCEGLEGGVYQYDPVGHALEIDGTTPVREALTRAAGDQEVLRNAPATVVLTANYDRTRRQYPDHGDRYVHMEAGHAAQNVHLVCESREMNSCPVGAFSDAEVAEVLALPDRLDPLYLLPVGHPVTA